MKTRAILFAMVSIFLFAPAIKAENGVVTIEGFRKAFALAFEENDSQLMESLVNWDGMDQKSKDALLNQLKGEIGGKITSLEIRGMESGETSQVALLKSINIANPQMIVYGYEKNNESQYGAKFFGEVNGRYCIAGFRDPRPHWPYWLAGSVLVILIGRGIINKRKGTIYG